MAAVSTDLSAGPDVPNSEPDLLDDGPVGTARERQRTCIASRDVLPEAELIRFVAAPDGTVVADLKRRLPGRGAWVRATRADVDAAIRKKAFIRAFRGSARPDADLADRLASQLQQAVANALGLARKAGLVVTGFAKVEAAIRGGRAVAVLHASDAAENGVAKLTGAMKAASAANHDAPLVDASLPSGILSMALGGEH